MIVQPIGKSQEQGEGWAAPAPGGEANQKDDDDQLTNDERWSLVWAAVNAYYTFDASVALALATAAFLAGIIIKVAVASDCQNNVWIVSLVMLCIRILDACCGCHGLYKRPVPTRDGFLCDIFRNLVICFTQGIVGLTMVIMSATLFGDDACLISAIVGLLSGLLLIAQAGEEAVIWFGVLFLWFFAGQASVPPSWVDPYIPQRVRDEILKTRKASKK